MTDPFDVQPWVLRVAADVVDALQAQDISVWSVTYESDPNDPVRQPVYVEAATGYDGDPVDPRDPEDAFPAVLDIDSDHGTADVYVETAPAIDFHGPDATAIWDLAVIVQRGDDGD